MNPESTRSQGAQSSFSMDDFAKALEEHDYEFQKGKVVSGKVFEYANDGAYVDIGAKSPAFLPISEAGLRGVVNLAEVLPLQEERNFLIIREQDADGQVTLSLRQLEIKRAWDELAQIQESGKSLEVRVNGVNKGGVTVDVHGLRGFIPRSHLLERHNLDSLLGQKLSVTFLEVDRQLNKIVLSQRMATRSAAISQLEIGQLVEGEIVSIKPFGVFVDLQGTTGLLHISQISKSRIESLTDVFSIGQGIKAIIVDIQEGQGRISLSTKVLENSPGEMLQNMDEVMNTAEARAKRVGKSVI